MDKVLVNIYVPILNNSYDMYIPVQIQLAEVIGQIQKAVVELSEGQFYADKSNALCRRESGEILNINKSAIELDIRAGSKLMLI